MSNDTEFEGGLHALLEKSNPGAAAADTAGEAQAGAALAIVHVSTDRLAPGRYQPRQRLSEESLAELADSMREQGVLQPLVVRQVRADMPDADREPFYEIVAGERRWHAARLAGLPTVPAVIRELDDQAALAVALIENLQREDLNPIDQAQSLSRLATEFELTHEQVAKAVGRSRASVSNFVRLLDLEDEVKDLLAEGHIDMGHARALLPLEPERQVAMANATRKRGLSVRQIEKAVRTLLEAPADGTAAKPDVELQTRWLQRQIAQELEQKFAIRKGRDGTYTLQVGFSDLGQLEETLQRIQTLVHRIRETAGPRTRDADGTG